MNDINALAVEVNKRMEQVNWPMEGVDYECQLSDLIDDINKILCKYVGHDPWQDHCGMAEHDYCGRCQAPTPGQAKR